MDFPVTCDIEGLCSDPWWVGSSTLVPYTDGYFASSAVPSSGHYLGHQLVFSQHGSQSVSAPVVELLDYKGSHSTVKYLTWCSSVSVTHVTHFAMSASIRLYGILCY